MKFWNFFLTNRQFTFLLIGALTAMGIFSLVSIPKESAPEVEVPIAVVFTALPGASASDVEALVTNRLERPLKSNLDDVKNITSSSAEGSSQITVEFDAQADLQESLTDLRDEIDIAKNELPDEAEDPRVIKIDFAAEPVVTLSLSAPIPEEALFEIGDFLKEELKAVKGVSSVSVSGLRPREVQVLLDQSLLRQFGLTPQEVVRAIGGANITTPAGSIEIDGVSYPVRFEGSVSTALHVASIPVTARGGTPVLVRDVATVIDGYADPSSLSRTSVEGNLSETSLSFDVFKASNADITDVSNAVNERVAELTASGGELADVTIISLLDRGELLYTDLSTLGLSGLETTLLVVIMLAVAIGWREALIAGLSIPLSLLIAFILMYYSGNTLNFVSLFSLVLVIGIIVDAAIVIVEGINTNVRRDDISNGIEAARATVKEFHIPLLAGTMTTVAVFAPLFMISGITGEFIKSIPFTVIAVLVSSLLVSIGFVPLIASRFAGQSIGAFGGVRGKMINAIRDGYRRYLEELLAHKRNASLLLTTILGMLLLSFSLPMIGALDVVFFESGDEDYMYVEIELPQGSTLARTDIELQKVEQVLYTVKDIDSFTTTAGSSSQYSGTSGSSSGERLGNIFIVLDKNRTRTSSAVADELREVFSTITTSDVRVGELSNGPPTGSAIILSFSGNDLAALDQATQDAARILKEIPGTTNITTTAKDNQTTFVLSFDRDRAMAEGATAADAVTTLRTSLFGSTATVLRGIDEDVDVVAKVALSGSPRPEESAAIDPDALLGLSLPRAGSEATILGSFATLDVRESRSVIRHDDGERIAEVTAGVVAGSNARNITQEFQARVDAGELVLPSGVTVNIGGENEDVDQSFMDMFVALILGIVAMFAILMLQFNSIRYAIFVLMTVPLSLVGVFAGLLIADKPISFPSMMGFIALAGIVVNNAIILIDAINNQRRAFPQQPVKEAVIEAATSRLRPVLLTTITTVIGIIPLLFTAEIWVPLALALIFGLAFATILTLALIPAVYTRWPGTLTAENK